MPSSLSASAGSQSIPSSEIRTVRSGWRSKTPPMTRAVRKTSALCDGCNTERRRISPGSSTFAHPGWSIAGLIPMWSSGTMPSSVAAAQTGSKSGEHGGMPPAGSEEMRKVRLPRSRTRRNSATAQSRSSKRRQATGRRRSRCSPTASVIQVFTAWRASRLRPGSSTARASVYPPPEMRFCLAIPWASNHATRAAGSTSGAYWSAPGKVRPWASSVNRNSMAGLTSWSIGIRSSRGTPRSRSSLTNQANISAVPRAKRGSVSGSSSGRRAARSGNSSSQPGGGSTWASTSMIRDSVAMHHDHNIVICFPPQPDPIPRRRV